MFLITVLGHSSAFLALVDLLHFDRFLDIKTIKALSNVNSKLIQPNSLQEKVGKQLRGYNKELLTCMLQRIATTTP